MPVSSVTEHWIKPDAITINLNHFGDPDYLQVSVLAGAVVMAFKQDVIGYNAAHNYRTWPLEAANTYLETSSDVNVYVKLTRSEVNARALIVYDTVLRDIEGREISYAEDGSEVLGDASVDYFFVFLGQISSSIGSSGQSISREWTVDFRFGSLDTSQYRNEESGGEWQKMFRLNKVTDMIDVLKTFSSAVFKKLFIGEKEIQDIKRSTDSDEEYLKNEDGEVQEDEEGYPVKDPDYVPMSDGTIPTSAYLEKYTDRHFLRKDKEDTAKENITFEKGIHLGKKTDGKGFSVEDGTVKGVIDELKKILLIESADFLQGELGSGFVLKYDKDKKRSYMEIDELLVRKLAYFISLVIKELKHVGGTLILSPASMKCSKVETYDTFYRCYFESEQDGKTINNEFQAGDLARCQTFNVKEGVNSNVRNTYYWRYVVAVGDNYIDLSITDCDAGSGVPQKGDEIVQLGNRYDDSRQNAIILSTVGDDAPSFKQYQGINNYYLSDDNAVTIFSPTNNLIKGKFVSKATGKDLDEELKKLQVDWGSVLEQTDKEFTMWFFEHEPTLDNEPAVDWDSEELKKLHDQDLFYNRESGLAYRFEYADGEWRWSVVTDADTIRALEKAAEADKKAEEIKENLNEIVSDGVLSALEKKEVLKEWRTIASAYPTNIANAEKYSVGSSVYTSAYFALGRYLGGGTWDGTGTPSWLSDLLAENTPIDADEYRSKWVDYYDAESALLDAISEHIKGIADNKKRVFVDTPYPPYDVGDMWVNATYGEYSNDTLVCSTSRAAYESFNISDWKLPNGYSASILNLGHEIELKAQAIYDNAQAISALNVSFEGITGRVTKVETDTSGIVTDYQSGEIVLKSNFAGLFLEQKTKEGLVSYGEMSIAIDNGISRATIQADMINFYGKTVINDKFIVDLQGNVTLNNLTANDGVFNGELNVSNGYDNIYIGPNGETSNNACIEFKKNDNVYAYLGVYDAAGSFIGGNMFLKGTDESEVQISRYGLYATDSLQTCSLNSAGVSVSSKTDDKYVSLYNDGLHLYDGAAISNFAISDFGFMNANNLHDFNNVSSSMTMPDPKDYPGRVIWVKGRSGNITLTCANKLIKYDETDVSSTIEINRGIRIFVSDGNYWFECKC